MDSSESFLCGICFDSYTKKFRAPITLSCGHTFCRRCVRHLDEGRQYIICGTCRSETHAKSGNIAKSFVLSQLLESLDLMSLTDEDEKVEDERERTPLPAQIDFNNDNFGGWDDFRDGGNPNVIDSFGGWDGYRDGGNPDVIDNFGGWDHFRDGGNPDVIDNFGGWDVFRDGGNLEVIDTFGGWDVFRDGGNLEVIDTFGGWDVFRDGGNSFFTLPQIQRVDNPEPRELLVNNPRPQASHPRRQRQVRSRRNNNNSQHRRGRRNNNNGQIRTNRSNNSDSDVRSSNNDVETPYLDELREML